VPTGGADFPATFAALRGILARHATGLTVTSDSPACHAVAGVVGPATIRAWGGKKRQERIEVGRVQIGKAYVSFHLMPIYANPALLRELSAGLRSRMQGKSCFNFTTSDEHLLRELDALTERAIGSFIKAGFVTPEPR
jgi:hypothetical protein